MPENHGWKSKETAQRYKHVADAVVPGRREVLSLIAGLAIHSASGTPHILDLGCGHGDLAAQVLELSPDANITLVDFSDEMLRMTSERFVLSSNIRVIKHNLNLGIPPEVESTKYDAVTSSFVLHHVDYDKRVGLYRQINRILKDDGLFINGDRFKEESLDADAWVFEDWVRWMLPHVKEHFDHEVSFDALRQRQLDSEEKLGDMQGTLWDMERDLRQAGFSYVDCLYKNMIVAVIAAQKAGGDSK